MKTIVFNDDNLTINDIEDHVIKARAVIMNDDGRMLLSKYSDIYLLPGGKIEENEDILTSLRREVREETGIELLLDDKKPFLLVKQLIKDYPKRNTDNDYSNRLTKTYYYITSSNEELSESKMTLTESENKAHFKTIYVEPKDVFLLLGQNNTVNPRNKYFTRELISVMKELVYTKK